MSARADLLPKQTVTKRLKAARRKLEYAEGKPDEEMLRELGIPAWLCRKVYGDEVRRLESMRDEHERLKREG